MNRAKKRELARKINTPEKLERIVHEVTREKEQKMKKEYNQKILNYLEVYIVMMCYVLDLEEIPKEKIPQIANRVLFNIDSFRTGHLLPEDYQTIKKEVEALGIAIKE